MNKKLKLLDEDVLHVFNSDTPLCICSILYILIISFKHLHILLHLPKLGYYDIEIYFFHFLFSLNYRDII